MTKQEFKEVSQRLKDIETNIAYLTKEINILKEEKPVEIHYHYHIDNSNYIVEEPEEL